MITVATIYYNQPQMLKKQVNTWSHYWDHPSVKFLVIDDCSEIEVHKSLRIPNLSIYRITDNIEWNQTGARNLIHKVAETDWVLSTDCDHVVDEELFKEILNLDMTNPNKIYFFGRKFTHGGKNNKMHSSFLVNRHTFNKIGGHDEDLAGNYGGVDQSFTDLCKRKLEYVWLDCLKVTTYQNDPKIQDANVSLVRDSKKNMKLIRYKAKNEFPRGKMIRFNYKKII